MRTVFADSFYWIALTDPSDPWHLRALAIDHTLRPARIITTELVLGELLNHFSGAGAHWRTRALMAVDSIRQNPVIEVLPLVQTSFDRGLAYYAARPDKAYSFVDCTSMAVMRELGIFEVLTHDAHFEQEGFVRLIG